MDVYVWLITICVLISSIRAQSCKPEPRCRVSRVHGMKGADCYQRDFRAFPQCLTSDVEIVDLSMNRIRRLSANDLKKYSGLKMLYLSDNVIVSIDDYAFEGKDDLNTLDLSINAISRLPPMVFHLPSLKSLYLGQNLNINIVDAVEEAKPVTSPLVQLDINYLMTEDPNELPDLGIMPYMSKYNISGNKLLMVSARNFAGLCSLKVLGSANISAEYENACDCWEINRWLKSRDVIFQPFPCDVIESQCPDEGVNTHDLETYALCREKVEELMKKARLMKILIPCVVIAILILIGVVYCLIRKRKQRRFAENRSKIPLQMDDRMLL